MTVWSLLKLFGILGKVGIHILHRNKLLLHSMTKRRETVLIII